MTELSGRLAMMNLETPQLSIRPFAENDIEAVATIHVDCFGPTPRDQVRTWLDWTVRNYIALAQLHQPPYGDYAIALRAVDVVVGSVGLVPCLGPFGMLPWFAARASGKTSNLFTPEVGLFWGLRKDYRGLGYAAEAAGAVAAFAFETLHVERLVATTEHDNLPSIKVMQQLGMTIDRIPGSEPHWFQTVGVLPNPAAV